MRNKRKNWQLWPHDVIEHYERMALKKLECQEEGTYGMPLPKGCPEFIYVPVGGFKQTTKESPLQKIIDLPPPPKYQTPIVADDSDLTLATRDLIAKQIQRRN